jgi:large subunit ribosomal protein L29
MPLPKIEDVRKLSDEELAAEVLNLKKQLFQLRLEQATNRLEKPHLFKHTKHRLSQLLTIERERELGIQREPKEDK